MITLALPFSVFISLFSRLRRGRRDLRLCLRLRLCDGYSGPERRNNGDSRNLQILLHGRIPEGGKNDQMVQTGKAVDTGTKYGRVCFRNPLMEPEELFKARRCEVPVLHLLQILFAIVDHEAVVGGKELDRECDPVCQGFPVVIHDCLLYKLGKAALRCIRPINTVTGL